ncbi:U-box domain-containing protein 9 [Glycine max]|nr:U-box domain-containing protein 9 [Glycine max]
MHHLSLSRNLDNVTVPPHFRCPLSGNLMTDPVILATGQIWSYQILVDLLEEGNPPTMKDDASALSRLCYMHENKGRIVREGAVQVILKKIVDHALVDELLALLPLLSTHPKAVEALVNHDVVPFLLDILREKENTTSECVKENCVAILYIINFNNREKRREIREDEMVTDTFLSLHNAGIQGPKGKLALFLACST